MQDPYDAFCPHSEAYLEGAGDGPLAGLSFAAKDVFDVAGHVTGCGNPDWLASHEPAQETAWAVDTLVRSGATMAGKTHTDDLTRGGFGENAHYGTPINPRAPDRVPGGSSSGSAAAVAGGLVDFALGTDTGGSVRIPASFCGLYGIRPTHGRLSMAGVLPQAPQFDTFGWLTRDAEMLARVGAVLYGAEIGRDRPNRVAIADDAFALADPPVAQRARRIALRIAELTGGGGETMRICPTDLSEWRLFQATLQRKEAWANFSDWIDRANPRFAFDTAEIFFTGATVDEALWRRARDARPGIVEIIDGHLAGGAVICLPTMPSVAPRRGERRSTLRATLPGMLTLTCIAGLAGAPALSLPVGEVDGVPFGISLIGARGSDEALLGFAREIGDALPAA